jgi:membrane-associated protein
MGQPSERYRARLKRCVIYVLVLWFVFAGLAPRLPAVRADGVDKAPSGQQSAEDKPHFFIQVIQNLFDSEGLMRTLAQPEYVALAFIALNVIVFTETGLLVGFFLPGDSLLVTAGLVCANPVAEWNVWLLIVTLCVSAIVGDSVGYSIGYKTGPKIFCREKSWFFNKDHLLKAQEFYERHGGKTIILARFMPILRTFAPVVAGVGKMEYRKFLFFNIFGGIGWVTSMVLTGYFLPSLLNPPLQQVFGPAFLIERHIEKVVIVVVLLSISPGIYVWLRSKFRRAEAPPAPQTVIEQVPVRAD